ncbi:type VI secretion system baseplate subunit TssF [Sinorhizobium fredii]|uniref:type VI secretion system baseplate subunit TssF n=1 Tax=Rhizobium fredii TaxID=380 RepID=UPI0004B496F8|nr:type VI secretion system baseplate subunit TssF [Sinorhizobium fredii]
MNREFLEFYDRELKILYERSQEFAEEFPGVGKRLGALTEEQIDPTIGGLLEGAAFMAARVQLKLKSEFDTFTIELLDQLLPGFLAPTPSFAIAQAKPDYANPALRNGIRLNAGQYIETTFMERERRVACRYRLVSDIHLWPYEVSSASYHPSAAPLQAQGFDCGSSVVAGLQIALNVRDNADGQKCSPDLKVSASPIDELTFHLIGPTSDNVSLCEQIFLRLERIVIRYLSDAGDPQFISVNPDAVEPIGFRAGESLFAHDERFFAGFNHLREYFVFPAKYLGFRLRGLAHLLKGVNASGFELMFAFSDVVPRLASMTKREWFALYAAPVTNLFEMVCAPVPVRSQEDEFPVIPDRSRTLDYEVYKILDVTAQLPRNKEAVRVFPLYSAPTDNVPLAHAAYYSARRLERRRTNRERRFGVRSTYVGTDTFISLREPQGGINGEHVRTLNVRALVTNRHLTDQLPVRRGGADFFLLDDTTILFDCIAGPTPPRECVLAGERRSKNSEPTGALLWKLISLLQFNHLGLGPRPGKQSVNALQELLMIFSDTANSFIERQIRGILDVSVRPAVRKVRQQDRYGVARGVEVTVTLDENAFEGQGAFLMGLVLSRFFTEYAALNTFVETVIMSKQRGLLKRWSPELGGRSSL